MAELKQNKHLCGRCKEDNEETEGVVYCSDCEEPLCIKCKQEHLRTRLTKSHKLCDLAGVPTQEIRELLKSLNVCPNHEEEKVVFLCKKHDVTCCGLCAREDHYNCKEVKVLKDILRDIKVDCSGLKTELGDLQHQGESLLEHERKHKAVIEKSEIKALAWLQTTKQKLHSMYEQIENDLLLAIADRRKLIDEQIKKHSEKINQYVQGIEKQSYLIESIEKIETKEQVFLLQRKLERDSLDYLKSTAVKLNTDRSKSIFQGMVDTRFDSLLIELRNSVRIEDLNISAHTAAPVERRLLHQFSLTEK